LNQYSKDRIIITVLTSQSHRGPSRQPRFFWFYLHDEIEGLNARMP